VRKHLWVARQAPGQLTLKQSTNRVVEGVAKTGEVSPKGTVAHIEDWDGRVAAEANPSAMHYALSVSTGRLRRLTFQEMVDKGYFILGYGPKGQR
jgi:hypothetical protein